VSANVPIGIDPDDRDAGHAADSIQ
jgi:hypothetical protein